MKKIAGARETGAPGRSALRLCKLVAQSARAAEGGLQARDRKGTDRKGRGAVGADLLQGLQEPDPGHRAGDRDGSSDAGHRQIARLLSGDDMRGLPRGSAMDNSNPQILLTSISRYYKFLPANNSSLSSKTCGRRHRDRLPDPFGSFGKQGCDALSGMPIPQRRYNSLLCLACEHKQQFGPQFVRIASHENVSS